MSAGKVLLALVAGVTAGALLGILYAPAKGKDTRKKISKKGEDVMDAIKEKYGDIVEGVAEKYQDVKGEVTDFVEKTVK